MAGSVDRLTRVNELIKRELAQLAERDSIAPAGTLVSITEVNTSVDLRNATVYVSVFGGGNAAKRTVEKQLHLYRPEWQRRMATTLAFKHTPVLCFRLDERMAAGDRVLEIIDEVAHREGEDIHE